MNNWFSHVMDGLFEFGKVSYGLVLHAESKYMVRFGLCDVLGWEQAETKLCRCPFPGQCKQVEVQKHRLSGRIHQYLTRTFTTSFTTKQTMSKKSAKPAYMLNIASQTLQYQESLVFPTDLSDLVRGLEKHLGAPDSA